MTAPTRDDGLLREALDAQLRIVSEGLAHERPGSPEWHAVIAYQTPKIEAAVRAALAPMASEPDGGLAFALEWVSNASHIATCSWERGGKDCDCGRKETLAILNRAATPQPPAAPVAESDAVQRASMAEMAEAMVWAIIDGTFADATEEQVRHAVAELTGKAEATELGFNSPSTSADDPSQP